MNPSSPAPSDPIDVVRPGGRETSCSWWTIRPWTAIWRGAIVQKMGGWHSIFAGNGVEALAVLEKQTPDVVLTDMLMPEMDGLQLVQAIRSKFPLVPVILMTAHGSEDIAIPGLAKRRRQFTSPRKVLPATWPRPSNRSSPPPGAGSRKKRLLARLESFETRFTLDNDTSLIPSLVGHLEDDINRPQALRSGRAGAARRRTP